MVPPAIYLDNHATTRVDPRVVDAMLPFFSVEYGNAASRHHVFGQRAHDAVEAARGEVASLIGAGPREIVFTSGATESNNLALKGVCGAQAGRTAGRHVVTVQTEHHAVLDVCKRLEQEGVRVTYLPVDAAGLIDPDQVEKALAADTVLVSVMVANNEIGVLQPIAEIGKLCKARGVLFHTDAAQAVGKIDLDVEAMGIDLLSVSAHKIYGPKGIGALFIRRRNPHVRLQAQMDGGGHERGLRSGTVPVPIVVGLGKACTICREEMADESARILALRERLRQGLGERIESVSLNGHALMRLPGNLNVSFAGVRSDALMMSLPGLAMSSGAACTTARVEPSHVLQALGLDDELAGASIRFGIGRFNTAEEIELTIEMVAQSVRRLRTLNPVWSLCLSQGE
jgi:cysteine desulfurase